MKFIFLLLSYAFNLTKNKELLMKYLFFIAGLSMLLMISCDGQKKSVKLEEGSPEYALAKDLAGTLPELDPDENKVVVKTKNFDVTTGETIAMIYSRIGNRQDGLKKQTAEQLRQIIVTNSGNIAEQKLLLDAAREANIVLPEAEFDSIMNLRYSRYGGEENYRKSLDEMGVDFEKMKSDMREGLTIDKLIKTKIISDDQVTEDEVAKKFEADYSGDSKATVQHILLMTQGKSEEDKAEVRTRMEGILERANAGEDFGKLAMEFSEDPGSKNRGGLYEDFERGTMVKPFEDASFNLPIGSISDIVETQYGYHIIKIVSRKKSERSLDEVRNRIVDQLKKEKVEAYVEGLKTAVNFENVGL